MLPGIPPPAHLDNFLKGILEENNKRNYVHEEKNIHKVQKELLNVLGPLPKSWQIVTEATKSLGCKVEKNTYQFREFID